MDDKKEQGKGSIRVLIVDDEAGFLRVIEKRMRKRGLAVTSANSGSEAIGILRKQDFDVAIVDLKMEDMDGIEVLKIFKKMVPGLPVIMLTGHGSGEAAREGIRQGAYDYLTKPCDLSELIDKIKEASAQGEKP
ncbi:MAG: response regulator [Elusimicrobiota bacterium]